MPVILTVPALLSAVCCLSAKQAVVSYLPQWRVLCGYFCSGFRVLFRLVDCSQKNYTPDMGYSSGTSTVAGTTTTTAFTAGPSGQAQYVAGIADTTLTSAPPHTLPASTATPTAVSYQANGATSGCSEADVTLAVAVALADVDIAAGADAGSIAVGA
jgi:hypothetical protein